MTLAVKRKMVEALLCASGGNDTVCLIDAMASAGVSLLVSGEVSEESYRIDPVSKRMGVDQRYGRQAYRMIESSPTLRDEWFGAP